MAKLHVIGFGSLNLDEFWEVSRGFLVRYDLEPGREYVRDLGWFERIYEVLGTEAVLKARDPGGSAANAVAGLRRMGFDTGFYGVTGDGDAELLRLNELGQREALNVRRANIPAGRCLALIDRDDPHKDRALVILPNANDLAAEPLPDLAYFEQAQWVHLTSFVSEAVLDTQIELVSRLSRGTGVSFDPGALYSSRGQARLEPLLMRSQILHVTEEELHALTAEPDAARAARQLLMLGVGMVVLKMGAEGIMAFREDKSFRCPGVSPRRISDRTGAGDVAAAGFLAGVIEGLPIEACLELAAAAASRSIEGYGRSMYPDREFFVQLASKWRTARADTCS